jgi:hypothetical protein
MIMTKKLLPVLAILFVSSAFLGAQDRYEPNDVPGSAYALSGTSMRLSDLHMDEGDVDWFRFTVSQAQILKIGTEGNLDTMISVYGPNSVSESFAEDDDDGEDYNASLTAYFSKSGIYYIKVSTYEGDESGPYTLFVSQVNLTSDPNEPNDDKSQAKPLDIAGLPKTFSLLPKDGNTDEDWFVLRLSSFQYQKNEGLSIYTGGETDTYLELYLGDDLIAENDDLGGENYNARITFVPQQQRGGANYYLLVKGYDESVVGDYHLYAETVTMNLDAYEPNNVRSQAAPISIGQTLTGCTFSEYDQEDWFTFTVSRKSNYIIGTEGDVDTMVELYSDGDESSISDDDDSGGDYNALLIANLDPGTYYIKVGYYSDDRDRYEYSIYVKE